MDTRTLPCRIVVVGTTGSGKTTMARSLAAQLGLEHVEVDALHWEPEWVMADRATFRERVDAATVGRRWVADGNYSAVRDILWGRADTLVWLDYPLPFILMRLTRRTLRRIVRGEELWNGNRESFASQFLSRDSLYLWALQSHPRHRREYPALLAKPEYAHLTVARLRSPRLTARWLHEMCGPRTSPRPSPKGRELGLR